MRFCRVRGLGRKLDFEAREKKAKGVSFDIGEKQNVGDIKDFILEIASIERGKGEKKRFMAFAYYIVERDRLTRVREIFSMAAMFRVLVCPRERERCVLRVLL